MKAFQMMENRQKRSIDSGSNTESSHTVVVRRGFPNALDSPIPMIFQPCATQERTAKYCKKQVEAPTFVDGVTHFPL
jgi:hypothetical protein